MNWTQLSELLPVGVVLASALIVVFLSLVLEEKDRFMLPLVAMAGCLLGLAVLAQNYYSLVEYYHAPPPWFAGLEPPAPGGFNPLILSGAFAVDGFGMAIAAVALLSGALAVLYALPAPESSALSTGEYYGLMLLAVAGMLLLGFSHDFLTLLISLEIMSVSTYILSGSVRGGVKSGEAALKYLVLGAFSTAILLLGIAFIFGATGSLSLAAITVKPGDSRYYLLLAGLGLLAVGLLFKVGAVPFHFWIPDVYEGAPTGVTGLMAAGVKAAAFAVLARVLFETFGHAAFRAEVSQLLWAAAIATMVLGNLVALQQTNVKRLLAYSGIAHTGYLLLAFLINPDPRFQPETCQVAISEHLRTVSFYLLAYALMALGAFGVVHVVREDGRPLETLKEYTGLAREHPVLALCMAAFMLSLAGLPPFAGFFAKFMVFRAAIEQGYVGAAVLGILTSVASLYYYLRVVREMYMQADAAEAAEAPAGARARCRIDWTSSLVIYGSSAATLLLGLFPHWAPGW